MRHKCLGLNIFVIFLIVLLWPLKSVIPERLTEYINFTSNDAVKNIPVLLSLLKQVKKTNQPQRIILCLTSPNVQKSSESNSILNSGVDQLEDNIQEVEEKKNFTKSYTERTRNIQLENNIMEIKSFNATLAKQSDFPETKEGHFYNASDILAELKMKLKKSKIKKMEGRYSPASETDYNLKEIPSPERKTEMTSVGVKSAFSFEPKILYNDENSNLPEKLKEFIEQNRLLPHIGCVNESKCFGADPGDSCRKGLIKPVKLIAKIYKEEPITDEVKQFAFYLPSNDESCEYKRKPNMNCIGDPIVKYPGFKVCRAENFA